MLQNGVIVVKNINGLVLCSVRSNCVDNTLGSCYS